MLELADCTSCGQNFLPAVDSDTGQIYQVNPDTFLIMTPQEKRQFITELPAAMEAIDNATGAMNDGFIPDVVSENIGAFMEEARAKAAIMQQQAVKKLAIPGKIAGIVQNPTPQPAIMPQNGTAPNAQGSLFVGFEPSSKPWFARTEVLIGGAAILLALGFGVQAATKR